MKAKCIYKKNQKSLFLVLVLILGLITKTNAQFLDKLSNPEAMSLS